MINSRNLLSVIFTIASFLLGILGIQQSPEDISQIAERMEETKIKKGIDAYFDVRYQALSTLKLDEFKSYAELATQERLRHFTEQDKMELEISHAEIHHLRYVEYKYFLEYVDISINTKTQTATVSVIEGHDVIFESSQPVVSSMRNLYHMITLQKSEEGWQVIDDEYEDYLWMVLKNTSRTKVEILQAMNNLQEVTSDTNDDQMEVTTPLSTSSGIVYPYNRSGAVNYALTWAYDRNPDYFDFGQPGYGGDCTNFISQAIYEGGGALMEFYNYDGTPTIGDPGWYYISVYDRGKAWPYVDEFYKFAVSEKYLYDTGPEGILVSESHIDYGDIIQFDWDGDGAWDHGVIVVDFTVDPYGNMIPLIASHNPDHKRYNPDYFNYDDIRFIHIERLKAPHGVFLPLLLKDEAPTGDPLFADPYPGPLMSEETVPVNPYPAPLEQDSNLPDPYPGP